MVRDPGEEDNLATSHPKVRGRRWSLVQVVARLQGRILAAAEEMVPSFHPNRWLLPQHPGTWSRGQVQPRLPPLPQGPHGDRLVRLTLVRLTSPTSHTSPTAHLIHLSHLTYLTRLTVQPP